MHGSEKEGGWVLAGWLVRGGASSSKRHEGVYGGVGGASASFSSSLNVSRGSARLDWRALAFSSFSCFPSFLPRLK